MQLIWLLLLQNNIIDFGIQKDLQEDHNLQDYDLQDYDLRENHIVKQEKIAVDLLKVVLLRPCRNESRCSKRKWKFI